MHNFVTEAFKSILRARGGSSPRLGLMSLKTMYSPRTRR